MAIRRVTQSFRSARRPKTISCGVGLAVALIALSGCGEPFAVGPAKTYNAAESLGADLHLSALGSISRTERWGTGTFSDPPTVEFQIDDVTADAAADLASRVEEHGFASRYNSTTFWSVWVKHTAQGIEPMVAVAKYSIGDRVSIHGENGGSERVTMKHNGLLVDITATNSGYHESN
jgi:hypothetical protein